MKKTLKQKGVVPIQELREMAVEAGVEFIPCQMTVDLFGWKKEDFMPGISDWAGAVRWTPPSRPLPGEFKIEATGLVIPHQAA